MIYCQQPATAGLYFAYIPLIHTHQNRKQILMRFYVLKLKHKKNLVNKQWIDVQMKKYEKFYQHKMNKYAKLNTHTMFKYIQMYVHKMKLMKNDFSKNDRRPSGAVQWGAGILSVK